MFRMRDYIESRGKYEPVMINMGGLDAGLYTVLGSVPECYYFQSQPIPLEDVWDLQKGYVKSEHPDYVLSIVGPLDFDMSGYNVAVKDKGIADGVEFDYWLYEYQGTD